MAHVFISYSHLDTEYAHALAAHLQEKGFETWIDERLDYGSQWPHELQKQLDTCSAFVVIMSPRSYASEWVQSELQRARRKAKPLFPLLLEGDEPWLSVESTQYFDVRGGKLPDAKFYSALERAVSASGTPVSQPVHAPKSAVAGKRNPGLVLGIIGAAALLLILAVAIPRLVSAPSPEPESSPFPSEAAAGTLPVVPSAEDEGNPTFAPPEPTPTGVDTSADFIDSRGVPMRFVPAGNFIMGNNASQYPEEKPVHTVYLDDFYIDTFEVTNARYAACVDAGECEPPSETGSFTRTSYYGDPAFDDFPVVNVDWEAAAAYCRWRGMKLPTEAQWEKAARGTDGRLYPWGNNIDQTYANYADIVGDTTEVGSYETGKSIYNVYDMSGNAWEWVADWFSNSYYLETPLTNPTGPTSGEYRVLRGGSWHDGAETVTTSSRGWSQLEYFYNVDFGFRCAMDGRP
ncbi:MAG TPA: SUMF1/EgtB/PvdO family nonheme iron enzyme [Anaerolineales bacterium]|nr:SUMF1/EgtB/PvdO family nonheme iron enzyme [Anaerolineales bacterium]